MRWFTRRPRSRTFIHVIEAKRAKSGRMMRPRWHVDIADAETNKLLFVCSPYGFNTAEEAEAAIDKLSRNEVVFGKRKKPH